MQEALVWQMQGSTEIQSRPGQSSHQSGTLGLLWRGMLEVLEFSQIKICFKRIIDT